MGHFSSWNLLFLQLLPPCYEGLSLLSACHRKSFLTEEPKLASAVVLYFIVYCRLESHLK